MKSTRTIFILLFVVFALACVPSLNPLYTEADLITDPKMVGTWVDGETGESWTISNPEKLKYSVVHIDSDGREERYDARLVKVGIERFLDLVPIKPGSAQNDLHPNRLTGTHTFVRVILGNATAQISYMEPRWLKDHLAENPRAIKHERIGGEIVLTSSPKETQKFLLTHLTTHEAFSRPAELSLKRGAQ